MIDVAADRGGLSPILRATGLSKRFFQIEVLHGVDLDLHGGEVHALLGENGAGKSTIINLLTGRLQLDGGAITLDGRPSGFRSPHAAKLAGISMIAQELELVPTLTVLENIFLGVEPTRFGLVRWREARRKVVALLRELGVEASPEQVVGAMSVADQQLVEVAKAIVGDFRVLIMDEPTSALNLADTQRLFAVIKRLKARGVAILYVSHRLWEVFEIADRVTTVRDGRRIFTKLIGETDVSAVIHGMLGDRSSLLSDGDKPRVARPPSGSGEPPALAVKGLCAGHLLRNIDLALHRGEIVGLAGVLGSGKTELCEALYGLRPIESGTITLDGVERRFDEPREALARGLFMLPEDRKSSGIFALLSVLENMILDRASSEAGQGDAAAAATPAPRSLLERAGLTSISHGRERRAFDTMRDALRIRCPGPDAKITALSGGNQQKALFARATLANPKVLILVEPTRGVDVGAKEEIYAVIESFARRGVAILICSSEISELMRLASEIHVVRNGEIVARLASQAATEGRVLEAMAG